MTQQTWGGPVIARPCIVDGCAEEAAETVPLLLPRGYKANWQVSGSFALLRAPLCEGHAEWLDDVRARRPDGSDA